VALRADAVSPPGRRCSGSKSMTSTPSRAGYANRMSPSTPPTTVSWCQRPANRDWRAEAGGPGLATRG
jgi:hypothetical protein